MHPNQPHISIGVPVRNGARFLELTLDSLLAQSYRDFELIISDNASSDQTEAICRSYTARDGRIRYYRSEVDLGLARNYNLLVEQAEGVYFKWAAADDLCEPDYLRSCLEVLEGDPAVVLAYAKAGFIDQNGEPVVVNDPGFDLRSDAACERLRYILYANHWVNAIFGLIRTKALAATRLLPKYPGGDYTLLGELAVAGKFVEVPQALFLRRLHPEASSQNTGDSRWLARLWTGNGRVGLPFWNRSSDHFLTIMRAELNAGEKLSLMGSLVRSMFAGRRRLLSELGGAAIPKLQMKS